jgi:hypothetical protein
MARKGAPVTPHLVVEEMKQWQAKCLRMIAWCIGLRDGHVLWTNISHEKLNPKPTINDIIKNIEENEMNRQVDKETGE